MLRNIRLVLAWFFLNDCSISGRGNRSGSCTSPFLKHCSKIGRVVVLADMRSLNQCFALQNSQSILICPKFNVFHLSRSVINASSVAFSDMFSRVSSRIGNNGIRLSKLTLYSIILALAYLGNFLLNISLYQNPSCFEFLYLAVFVLVLFFFIFDASPSYHLYLNTPHSSSSPLRKNNKTY